MKILSKKQYRGLVDKIEELEEEKEKIKKKYDNKDFRYLEKYNTYRDKSEQLEKVSEEHLKLNGELRKEIDQLNKKLEKLKEKLHEERKGFKTTLKALEKQLEESMSDKYLVRKVRGTKPTKQTTKIKSSVVQSSAIKLVKEKL